LRGRCAAACACKPHSWYRIRCEAGTGNKRVLRGTDAGAHLRVLHQQFQYYIDVRAIRMPRAIQVIDLAQCESTLGSQGALRLKSNTCLLYLVHESGNYVA
jgi:hypothetical protein